MRRPKSLTHRSELPPMKQSCERRRSTSMIGSSQVLRPPLEGPLQVTVRAFMPMATTWSKKKTASALAGGSDRDARMRTTYSRCWTR